MVEWLYLAWFPIAPLALGLWRHVQTRDEASPTATCLEFEFMPSPNHVLGDLAMTVCTDAYE